MLPLRASAYDDGLRAFLQTSWALPPPPSPKFLLFFLPFLLRSIVDSCTLDSNGSPPAQLPSLCPSPSLQLGCLSTHAKLISSKSDYKTLCLCLFIRMETILKHIFYVTLVNKSATSVDSRVSPCLNPGRPGLPWARRAHLKA